MPYIYTRAKMVCVWLGLCTWSGEGPLRWEENFGREKILFIEDTDKEFLTHISENPYWKRVWITQEIGLARKIRVHYGKYTADWGNVVKRIKNYYQTSKSLPVQLQTQIEEKYEEGHKLQALIERHKEKLCRENRDHIYGFVGLASDADGLECGYDKSLYQVWKDTVRYKNRLAREEYWNDNGTQHDILGFGRLVQTLLGGRGTASKEEVQNDIDRAVEIGDANDIPGITASTRQVGGPKEIMISARLSGKIVGFGPTYDEIISNVRAADAWKASLKKFLPKWEIPATSEENDFFLETLEEVTESDLGIVSSYDRDIKWNTKNLIPAICRVDVTIQDQGENSSIAEPSPTKDPRLCVLHGVANYGEKSSGRVRLAPEKAMVGDYIALIHGIKKAVVVRVEGLTVTLVGTAAMVENRFRAQAARDAEEGGERRTATASFGAFNQSDRLNISVDIGTAYELMD